MIVIGELINSTRKVIAEAIKTRDTAYLQDLARKQAGAGAHYIDINAAVSTNEVETIKWLVDIVQEVVDVPICVDSPDPEALRAALSICKQQAMVNSISAETERWEAVLPVIKEYGTKVIALCMDNKGMPKSVEDRLLVADKLVSGLAGEGITEENIFLDPLVKPLGVNHFNGLEVLETTSVIRQKYPKVHIIPGLSNISFGLPERRLLNRALMVMGIGAGMDAFILDPLDNSIMSLLAASKAIVGQDEFCMEYITSVRVGTVKA